MFVPSDQAVAEQVGNDRVTRGQYEDGEGFSLSDYWRSSRRPDRETVRKWKGSKTFQASPSMDGPGVPNSAARWLTPRGPGIPEVQDRNRWADCTSSEEDAAGEPAYRSPVTVFL